MSYNGSGTFVINSTGQPVVTGTVISSSTFNSLTADLGTGLSTAITKDGQTTTTAKIPFAQGLSAAVASNFAAGTVGAPSIYLSTDTTTGLYRIGANNDGFAISGVKLLDIGSALLGITGALTVSTTLNVTGVATLGNGAVLGTPASGTVTNLTGTASININGTVGATTPTTGAFTSGTFSTTLGVTGVLTGSSLVSVAGLRVSSNSVPAAGSGAEVLFTGGNVLFQGYNRDGSVYLPVQLSGLTVSLQIGGTEKLGISAAGAVTIPGTLGVTGNATLSNGVTARAGTSGVDLGYNGTTYMKNDANGFSFLSQNPYPATDNSLSFGITGQRWSAIWAANGTIQTSDDREKIRSDIPIPGLDFVNAIEPFFGKWIVGGNQYQYNNDGIPICDEKGNHITKPVAGMRTHAFFSGQEIKKQMVAMGLDWGAYVYDEKTDNHSLRPDQLIPVLWKSIQELSAKIATLESRTPQ